MNLSSNTPRKIVTLALFFFLAIWQINAQKRLTDFYSKDFTKEIPTNFIEFGGKTYFLATDTQLGRNLWVSDGTKTGTKFFLETEANSPETNQALYYKTDSVLYVFSKQNLWQIDKKQVAKKLNQNPLIISNSNNPSFFDNKLFFNSVDYFDLKTRTFQRITFNEPVTLSDDNLRYFYECTHDKIRVISFYQNFNVATKKIYILEQNQTQFTAFDSYNTSIAPIYRIGNDYFSVFSEYGIYKLDKDRGLQTVLNFNNRARVLYQTFKNNKIFFITQDGTRLNHYAFDGSNTDNFFSQDALLQYSSLQTLNKDSLFLAKTYQSNNEHKIIKLNSNSEFETKLTLSKEVYDSFVKVQNDSIVSIGKQIGQYYSQPVQSYKTAILNTKTFKTEYIDIGDPVLLPNNNLIGQKEFEANKPHTFTLFNATKNEFLLLARNDKTRPKSMGFTADFENNSIFIAVNDYDKGKSIYLFNQANELGKLIYSQKDSTFAIGTRVNSNAGVYVENDIFFYTSSYRNNIVHLVQYNPFPNYSSINFLYDYQKNTVTQPPSFQEPVYTVNNKNFIVESNQLREVDLPYINTIKIYPFPTDFQRDKAVFNIGNCLYFWGAKGGKFANHLFVFDGNELVFKRVTELPVRSISSFKNRPVLILENGDVQLLDSQKGFQLYDLFQIKIDDKNYERFQDSGDFFTVSSQGQIYYSDGDCENSGLVDVPNTDNYGYVSRVPNSNYYTIPTNFGYFLGRGKSARKFPFSEGASIGTSNKYLYYAVGVGNKVTGNSDKSVIYQINLLTLGVTLLDTVNGYFSNYSANFKVLEKGKKWLFVLGNRQFTITDKGKNADEVIITQSQTASTYGSIIYTSGVNAILIVDKEIIVRRDAQNTVIAKADAGAFWVNSFYLNQSKEYLYVQMLIDNKVKKVARINKQDFSVTFIEIPFGIRAARISGDTAPYYPMRLVGDKLYGIVESPNEGQQLWLLDEIKQTPELPTYLFPEVINPVFEGNADCVRKSLKQTIPTNKVETYGIFPNPTSKYLFLNLPKAERDDIQEIVVYDALGRMLSNQLNRSNFSINPDLISLDLPNVAAGTYFLKIQLSDKVLNFKFVVY